LIHTQLIKVNGLGPVDGTVTTDVIGPPRILFLGIRLCDNLIPKPSF